MRLLQAIDIGTNSVRSIVVEVPVGGSHRIIDDEKEMTRLGQGLDATGQLDPDAVDRTVSALKAMMDIGRNLGVTEVHAIATEAVRRAANGEQLVARLRDEAGLDVEIVSAQEGRLVWLSAMALTAKMPQSVIVDIGGGSVEIVQAVGEEPVSIVSMRLGARVMSERFLTEDPPSDESFKNLKRFVRRTLRDCVTPLQPGIPVLVGSGGAITSIASLVAGMHGRRHESLQGVQVERPEIMQLLGILSHSTAAERLALTGMPAERVDIILAGTLVLAEVLKLFGAGSVLVNARGIREGIVLDALASDGAIDSSAPDHMESVRDVGRRYRYDRQHAEHVTQLALSIFDQLTNTMHLEPADRRLLESAAMLHDIGYYIAYDRHHRHSYHLILHSGLPGLTRRETRMVAAIARYHTKALPKRSHESWAAIEPADRATVRQLAAILRIADGLDRGRGARVRSVEVSDDGATTRFEVLGEVDLHAELYGVGKKKDLFEETFGRRVEVAVPESE